MNHMGRTILTNKVSRPRSVVAHSRTRQKPYKLPFKKTILASSIHGLALLFLLNTESFAQNTYDGEQTSLTSSSQVAGNLQQLFGADPLNGYVVTDAQGSILSSDAVVTIDYDKGAAPSFVIAGHNGLFESTQQAAATSNNVVTIKKGAINGDVYAGLVHNTPVITPIECLSLGKCDVRNNLDGFELTADANRIQYEAADSIMAQGSLNAGIVQTRQELAPVVGSHVTSAFAQAMVDSNNGTLSSTQNSILIKGEGNQFNDAVNAGLAEIYQSIAGIEAGHKASSNVTVFPKALNNRLLSNENTISIDAAKNTVKGDLNAGQASIKQVLGDFISADFSGANTRANADTRDNHLTANSNTISLVEGQNTIQGSLNAGVGLIDIQYGASHAGPNANGTVQHEHSVYTNQVTANQNSIRLNSDQNTISGDLNAGAVKISTAYGDAFGGGAGNTLKVNPTTRRNELSSHENKIQLSGNHNAIQGSLNAGQAVISQAHGQISGKGLATGNSHFDSNTAVSDRNTIEIRGNQNTIHGNVNAGVARMDYAFKSMDEQAQGSGYMNNNTVHSNENVIRIYGKQNTIKGDIIAGYAGAKVSLGDVNNVEKYHTQIANMEADANRNKINLLGSSSLGGSIYGGYASLDLGEPDELQGTFTFKVDTGNDLNANHNTINIGGKHTMDNKDGHIYGGYLAYSTADGKAYRPKKYDTFTGNTLNYGNLKPISIGTIGNFQTYNFMLNPEFGNTDTALITADHIIMGANEDNFSGRVKGASDVFVKAIYSGEVLETGTEFILMQGAISGEGQGHPSEGLKQIQQGISLLYDVETKVDQDNGKVTATIVSGHKKPDPKPDPDPDPKPDPDPDPKPDPDPDPKPDPDPDPKPDPGPTVNPQLKSLLEANLSGLMLLTRGADNIAYNTFHVITEQNRHKGLVPFIQASGHHSRYKSGSHIDADGALLTLGFSYQDEQLAGAAFIESGTANYDSYNSFARAAKVHGKGDNRYYGLGLYGQYGFENGVYVDGSLRGGRLRTDYSTNDIRNAATDEAVDYKVKGSYVSAHIGTGYVFQWQDSNQLDVSLKYLWTQTSSHDVVITGDPIHFDRLKSNRIRFNAENSHTLNTDWAFLSGLGFEYEFDGKANGTTYGRYDIDEASVRGFTTIATLGARYQPESNKRLAVDFKGNGYVGKRQGGSVTLKVQYAF